MLQGTGITLLGCVKENTANSNISRENKRDGIHIALPGVGGGRVQGPGSAFTFRSPTCSRLAFYGRGLGGWQKRKFREKRGKSG